MSNPWLAVPLAEYEQHMSSVEVGQLGVLADLFAKAMARCRPSSIAILGIAGGNGLDHVDIGITSRVVGLDLNPSILKPSGSGIRIYPALSCTALTWLKSVLPWNPFNWFTRL